jgi:hypothetical protein
MPLHGHNGTLAQVPSTKAILLSVGPTPAEFPTEGASSFWLTPTGTIAWTVGSRVDESDTPAVDVCGLVATATHIYRATLGTGNLAFFARFSDTGVRTDNIFPSVDVGDWGGTVSLQVSPDESTAYFIFAGYWGGHRIGRYSGGSWTVANQTNYTDMYGGWEIRLNNPVGLINVQEDLVGGINIPSISSIVEDQLLITADASAVIDDAGTWENLIDGDIIIENAWQNINEVNICIDGVWCKLVPK